MQLSSSKLNFLFEINYSSVIISSVYIVSLLLVSVAGAV